jgi:hypothetical protein
MKKKLWEDRFSRIRIVTGKYPLSRQLRMRYDSSSLNKNQEKKLFIKMKST